MPSDVGQRRERRSQDERRRRLLDGEADSDGRSERLAEVHDTGTIDIRPAQEVTERRPGIGRESLFAWNPLVAAVATVVREEDLQSMLTQRGSQRCPVGAIAGVSTEDQDGQTWRRTRPRQKPGAKPEPVGGVERDRLTVFEIGVSK